MPTLFSVYPCVCGAFLTTKIGSEVKEIINTFGRWQISVHSIQNSCLGRGIILANVPKMVMNNFGNENLL
jgi:hypothetical protein